MKFIMAMAQKMAAKTLHTRILLVMSRNMEGKNRVLPTFLKDV